MWPVEYFTDHLLFVSFLLSMASRQDRVWKHAQAKAKVAKKGAASRLANVQPTPGIGSRTSSSSPAGARFPHLVVDQQPPLMPVIVQPSASDQQTEPNALIWRKCPRAEFVDNVDLTWDDSPDKYRLPSFFLQQNFFEGGPSLSVHRVESLYIEGMDAAIKQRILAQDATAMIRVLELAVLYSDVSSPFHKQGDRSRGGPK